MSFGRNDTCPCGSGRKVKKCHPQYVGVSIGAAYWHHDMESFIERMPGYMPPADGRDGWSLPEFKRTGCPFDACPHDTEGTTACLAGCGV